MEKLCFVKGCIQPAIGGKRTDDGLDVPLCEFHFSEDFLAHLDEDEKEDAEDEDDGADPAQPDRPFDEGFADPLPAETPFNG